MRLDFSNIGEGHLEIHLTKLQATTNITLARLKTTKAAYDRLQSDVEKLEDQCHKQLELIAEIAKRYPLIVNNAKRKAQHAVDELESQFGHTIVEYDSVEQEAIAKARTVAIFESILFAIENWATDDVPASDFTPVAQAVLFKTTYIPVMKGNSDYYLDEVPFTAIEIVKRGREYVKGFRAQSQTPLTDPSVRIVAQEYQSWWVNDALPLIYGARDPDWETTTPYSSEEMELWRSTDMDKTTHFPNIFDAFELTRKYGDEIRESSGLPQFTKQIMQTRLTAHE